jgi:hypothetical protein
VPIHDRVHSVATQMRGENQTPATPKRRTAMLTTSAKNATKSAR